MPIWYIRENRIDSLYDQKLSSAELNQLKILSDYDAGRIVTIDKHEELVQLVPENCISILSIVKSQLQNLGESVDYFAVESTIGSFEGIIISLYQSIGGNQLYPYFEDKAAHLLYLIIKNHPFIDGNKRSAITLFNTYFTMNVIKTKYSGQLITGSEIDNTTFFLPDIVNIALLIAESKPENKDSIIDFTTHIIRREFVRGTT